MEKLPKTLRFFEEDPEYKNLAGKELAFEARKHAKYFQMCLNILPARVQTQDSNKLSLVYFSLVALDMLNEIETSIFKKPEEREETINWVYEHYMGEGFRGSLTHDLATDDHGYDPPHLPSTYFALCILSTLKDDSLTKRIDRFKIMTYLRKCQLSSGSFSSVLDIHGKPYGENDLRMCLIASSIRKMLQIDKLSDKEKGKYDIDIDSLERYIMSCISYNGGLGGNPLDEAHAGYTFCGLVALKLIGRIKQQNIDQTFSKTIQWLSRRQFWVNKYNKEEFKDNEYLDFDDLGGFNGRENKYADTCYAFWVIGSLKILEKEHIVNVQAVDYYLLNGTQHSLIGGFGKVHDDTPDPYHSALGIAALKLAESEHVKHLKDIDVQTVITSEAKEFLMGLVW
ncbi:protein geranylgeranyltransferase type I subunit [Saccharomycopsis crataegensis]|uniref:Geranylgeranyl transferase type-1 subunit beta n=1 Tax=Saccharomycopsis crataegensis TaxID=43959 RepID=A0AAV5QEN9_9ASCO|nr:protein geranylgeranyltransferase type I subunit [Saccharomycopsis crataegensis]